MWLENSACVGCFGVQSSTVPARAEFQIDCAQATIYSCGGKILSKCKTKYSLHIESFEFWNSTNSKLLQYAGK